MVKRNQYDDDAYMKRVIKFIDEYQGIDGITALLLRKQLGLDKDQSKLCIHRAFKRGFLVKRKDRRHRIVRGIYDKIQSIPPKPIPLDEKVDITPTPEVIPQPTPPPSEPEPLAITPERRAEMHKPQLKRADIRFHAYTFVLKKAYFSDSELSGFNVKHSLVNPSDGNFIVKQIPALELFAPIKDGKFNPNSISSLWNTKGYRYNEHFKSHTGAVEYDRNRTMRFEVFENNTVNIYVECSQNPLNALEVLAMFDVLKAMIKVLSGLEGGQLSNLIMVKRVETNIDEDIGEEKLSAIPFQCLTLTTYVGDHIQLYLKDIDDKTKMRTEIVREPNQPLSPFMQELDAITFGGMPGQYFMSGLFVIREEIRSLAKVLGEQATTQAGNFDRFFNAQAISVPAMARLLNTLDRIEEHLAPRSAGAVKRERKRGKARAERELGTFGQEKHEEG